MYLLDTNIILYTFRQNPLILEALDELCQEQFYISVITRLEALIGHRKEGATREEVESFLDFCVNFDITKDIVSQAIDLHDEFSGKLKFKDLVIAATAKKHKKTLITADKDFVNLPGLKVKYLSL